MSEWRPDSDYDVDFKAGQVRIQALIQTGMLISNTLSANQQAL
ncbi:hypothetical protein ABE288_23385 [Bacillus salipaludis]